MSLVWTITAEEAEDYILDDEAEEWEHEEHGVEPDEVPFPSIAESMQFFEEEAPIVNRLLEMVKAEEGEAVHDEVLRDLQERHFQYLEMKEYDGEEAANVHLASFLIELRIDELLHDYRRSEEGNETREEIELMLLELLQESLAHEKRAIQMQLQLIEGQIHDLEQELESLDEIGEDELRARVLELLGDDEE